MIVRSGVVIKPLFWIGPTREVVREFPAVVRQQVGFGLYLAQAGDIAVDARPVKGFGGGTVLEIRTSYRGDAFRTVYTVRFSNPIYVLHAFKKKSTKGIATPRREIEVVARRMKRAGVHDEQDR